MSNSIAILQQEAIALLQSLIATPSFSKQENETATLIANYLMHKNVAVIKIGNNVIAKNKYFDTQKPTILLNSHHDTVLPNKAYTLPPHDPIMNDGKLFGLGSNDAGGCLVSLIACFMFFYDSTSMPYNLIMAATAEEEISGTGGVEMILSQLPKIDFAIVGEPTQMQMAVAEKGLMVIDATATGIAGHAARNEGVNAVEIAVTDILALKKLNFNKVSALLGNTKCTVTVINTENKQHNVVPASCNYVIDVRVNELYTHEEVLQILQATTKAKLVPRSFRMRSSAIDLQHPIVQAGLQLNKTYYGSPTTSDKALMPFVALKIGPGDSARSHTADEFIFIAEIENGITDYIQLLQTLFNSNN